MADNLTIALALAAAGCPTFPCYATSGPHGQAKRCLTRIAWRSEASTDPRRLATWWDMEPDALPALTPDKLGLFVVDLDRHHEGKNGVEAWAELVALHGEPNAPAVGTPSGGMHLYFRQPAGAKITNARGILPPGIDIRGAGGYVIAPGTTLPDGRQYYGCDIAAVIRDAPEAPAWLLAMIQTKAVPDAPKNTMARLSPATVASIASDARVKAYAEVAFAAELAELRATQSNRNDKLNACAFSIGTLVGAGWIGEGEARAALTGAAVEIGLTRGEIGPTITSGLTSGMKSPRQMPEPDAFNHGMGAIPESFLRLSDGALYDGDTGEVIEADAVAIEALPAVDWLEPGGLLGEIADWIIATTPSVPNRPLAVAAAVALMCAVMGRSIIGPTRSGTHLYIACLGETGCGKDYPSEAIGHILEQCELQHHWKSGQWRSQVALENAVRDMPCHLAIIDEIGASLFSPVMNKRAGDHIKGISATLRTLWGKSASNYATSGSASRNSETIRNPALSLFGMSTPDEFYESLTGGAIDDGFLTRFTMIRAHPRGESRDEAPDMLPVPETIKAGLKACLPAGNIAATGRLSYARPTVKQLKYAEDGTREKYAAFKKHVADWVREERKHGKGHKLLSRTCEMAIRLATIHAVSRAGPEADVNVVDFDWGRTIAEMSSRFLIEDVSELMSENEDQAKARRVEAIIKREMEHDKRGVSWGRIMNRVDSTIKRPEVKAILEALCEGGRVMAITCPAPATGGHATVRYKIKSRRQTGDIAA